MDPELDDREVYEILSKLLLAGRLAPGTKLVEHKIARVMGVSRERVRKTLHRLGHERLLELIPNRGAFVVEPTLEEARQIYDARRVVESGIALRLAETISEGQLGRLKDHLKQEAEAAATRDRPASIRLSGAFHLRLAEMIGSDYIERQMQELVSRTAMLVAFYEPGNLSECGCDEHATIVAALACHDPAAAAKAMNTHLSLIETRLRPAPDAAYGPDLETVLREELASRHRREDGVFDAVRSGARDLEKAAET